MGHPLMALTLSDIVTLVSIFTNAVLTLINFIAVSKNTVAVSCNTKAAIDQKALSSTISALPPLPNTTPATKHRFPITNGFRYPGWLVLVTCGGFVMFVASLRDVTAVMLLLSYFMFAGVIASFLAWAAGHILDRIVESLNQQK